MTTRSISSCAFLASLASTSALASLATAGQIAVSSIGGGVMLNSGPFSSIAFGNAPQNWTSVSLGAVHASINAGGIATDGKVTFLAADTDRGLAMMALIDQQLAPGSSSLGSIHMDTVANGSNLAYVNDAGGLVTVTPTSPNSRFATGNFSWNSNGSGDAFAWAGLAVGNSMTFRFNRIVGSPLGLMDPGTFQFINWTGSAWALIDVPQNLVSFSETDDFGFAATVVPAPSMLLLMGGPLMGFSLIRRRATR